MKEGVLFYNQENGRIGISFDDGMSDDGLHCGKAMEVKIDGKWIPARIEMNKKQWYLVGITVESLRALRVRV